MKIKLDQKKIENIFKLGIGPNPQSPIPNPHYCNIKIIIINILFINFFKLYIKNINNNIIFLNKIYISLNKI
jgi:hypothetical protein